MHSIFDTCQDTYGMCIRQYIDTGFILLISLVSLYSVIQTYKNNHQVTFDMLPLTLNFIISLLTFFLQIFFEEYFNTHLIFMFIEVFTYYLLTYALVWMFLNADTVLNKKVLKKINVFFVIGSVLIILITAVVTTLSFLNIIQCTTQYWISTVAQTLILLPIYICTLIYCKKTKQKIYQLNKKENDKIVPATLHFINEEDSYVKLKILQTNLNQITFTFSMLLHIVEISLYFFMENDSICLQDANKISVRNPIELSIMIIKNLSELIPHIMILLIFWIIPQKIEIKSQATIYISPKKINYTTKIESQYKIDSDQQEIHKKLIY